MLEFMQSGGVPMIIVLVFGLVTLGVSGRFAWSPREAGVATIRAMSAATAFAILSGVSSAVGAVMSKVPRHPEWSKSPDLALIVMTGLGESMAPAILGFTILALAWMLTAMGMRRLV
jgi:predicted benzoate:H+ symporter BenE